MAVLILAACGDSKTHTQNSQVIEAGETIIFPIVVSSGDTILTAQAPGLAELSFRGEKISKAQISTDNFSFTTVYKIQEGDTTEVLIIQKDPDAPNEAISSLVVKVSDKFYQFNLLGIPGMDKIEYVANLDSSIPDPENPTEPKQISDNKPVFLSYENQIGSIRSAQAYKIL